MAEVNNECTLGDDAISTHMLEGRQYDSLVYFYSVSNCESTHRPEQKSEPGKVNGEKANRNHSYSSEPCGCYHKHVQSDNGLFNTLSSIHIFPQAHFKHKGMFVKRNKPQKAKIKSESEKNLWNSLKELQETKSPIKKASDWDSAEGHTHVSQEAGP